MEIERGQVWWADLPKPVGPGPGFRRPVVIVQSSNAIDVGLQTLIVVPLTTNRGWTDFPGNVLLPAKTAGLAEDSVANMTQLLAIDMKLLEFLLGQVPMHLMNQIDEGLRIILALRRPPGTLQ